MLALSRWVAKEQWEKSHIVLTAWALLQDSFHTTLNLDHPANKMAVAVLYLAVHCCKLIVPSEGAGRQWWSVQCPGIKETQLQAIAEQIMAVYEVEQVTDSIPGRHIVSSSVSDRTPELSGCREVNKCVTSQDPDCVVIE